MPDIVRLDDKTKIEEFFRRDVSSHIYALADLDDFFWPETTWFGLEAGGRLEAVVLMLTKLRMPVVYAVSPAGDEPTRELLAAIRDDLPREFFANLGPEMDGAFEGYAIEPAGEHLKMTLDEPDKIPKKEDKSVERLSGRDLEELGVFYGSEAYLPEETAGRFFEPYMLERWPYFGIREHDELVCAGGVHVLSEAYGVAAIGNIATRPDRRGKGLGSRLTARLCRDLRKTIADIGLNVNVGNDAGIRCYRALGFKVHCLYVEAVFSRVG